MPLLNNSDRSNTGQTNHEYASKNGWHFSMWLSHDDYIKACQCFNNVSEMEEIAEKHIRKAIKYRMSYWGRILHSCGLLIAWIGRIAQN